MNAEEQQSLAGVIARDSRTAVAALAAAERAVEEGRLNMAKVLRALALAARARALSLERTRAAESPAPELFESLRAEYRASTDALAAMLVPGTPAAVRTVHDAAQSLTDVLMRTSESLREHRDVPESVVAQFLWGCAECGYVAEAARPEICPACGSVAGDFEMFAPFFSATTDRIARRQPAQIVEMLRAAPAAMRESIAGVPDAKLRWSSAPGEWCMKEIAGHTIDIAELFVRRFRAALDPAAPQDDPAVLPWKIIDGQDYPAASAGELCDRFDRAIRDALSLVEGLPDVSWRKRGEMLSGKLALLDMGSWLANHNGAHLEQIRALSAVAQP